jgi:hypothetical protein
MILWAAVGIFVFIELGKKRQFWIGNWTPGDRVKKAI